MRFCLTLKCIVHLWYSGVIGKEMLFHLRGQIWHRFIACIIWKKLWIFIVIVLVNFDLREHAAWFMMKAHVTATVCSDQIWKIICHHIIMLANLKLALLKQVWQRIITFATSEKCWYNVMHLLKIIWFITYYIWFITDYIPQILGVQA